MRGSYIVVLLAVLGAALIVGFTIFRPQVPGRPMAPPPDIAARQPAEPAVQGGAAGSAGSGTAVPPGSAVAEATEGPGADKRPVPAPLGPIAALPKADEKTGSGSTIPAASAAAAPPPQVALRPPSFDVVRISRNCTAVLAGRATPGVLVTIKAGEQELGRVTADPRGEWVLVPDLPLESGTRELSLEGSVPGQDPVPSSEVVVVVVPSCAPGQPEHGEQAIAVLTPRQGGSRLLQVPSADGDTTAAKGLSLDTVDYDDTGNLTLSGRADAGTRVQAYVNNQPVGTGTADRKGRWQIDLESRIDPGIYTLRVDQIEESGKVQARIELPFSRANPQDIVMNDGQVVVQPGNSLWRIARRLYGEGMEYTVIYRANQDQIMDPDLIYPGQIFTLPQPAGGEMTRKLNVSGN